MNELPEGWVWKKLGEVCVKISLNGIKIKQKEYLDSGLYPVVDQGQSLIGGYFNDASMVVPNEPPYIVFGDHTKVKKYIPFKFIAGADGVKVLKPHPYYDSKFFFYLIHTISIPDKGYARHFQLLEKEHIPLPPLPVQHAIVTKIEEIFSELDHGVEQLKTARAQLKVFRQAVLKWAFEGRLTNEGVKDGELVEGWEIKKLKDIGDWRGGGTPTKSRSDFWNGGDILWVSPKDMKSKTIYETVDKITPAALENSSAKIIPRGSILFVVRSGILRRVMPIALTTSDVTVNQDLQALTPKEALPDFVYWYLQAQNDDIRKSCSKDGTTVESIESSLLKAYPILVPPLPEQHQIVSEIERRLSVCDKLEETIEAGLRQAEVLRAGVLKMAFEGKLV